MKHEQMKPSVYFTARAVARDALDYAERIAALPNGMLRQSRVQTLEALMNELNWLCGHNARSVSYFMMMAIHEVKVN